MIAASAASLASTVSATVLILPAARAASVFRRVERQMPRALLEEDEAREIGAALDCGLQGVDRLQSADLDDRPSRRFLAQSLTARETFQPSRPEACASMV